MIRKQGVFGDEAMGNGEREKERREEMAESEEMKASFRSRAHVV